MSQWMSGKSMVWFTQKDFKMRLKKGFYCVEQLCGTCHFILCHDNKTWEVLISDVWSKIQFRPEKPNGELMTLKEIFSAQIECGSKIFYLGL